MHSRMTTQETIMSSIVSQSIITRRIIGSWMFKQRGITITNSRHFPQFVQYDVDVACPGYASYRTILTIDSDGTVSGELTHYGNTICTASTLAGFISLLKNCKRWSEEAK